MSTPARPMPSTPVHSTRQELDELDALMQQMLALPAEEPDEFDDPLPEARLAADTHASSPRLVETASGAGASPQLPALPALLLEEERSVTAGAAPEPSPFEGFDVRPVRADVHKPEPPPSSRTAAGRRPRAAWWLRPLVWPNQAFDRSTHWLGAPGRWLRGPQGRSLLGWLGLLFLSGALGWVALDTIGWPW
jgi:hypothetical protein